MPAPGPPQRRDATRHAGRTSQHAIQPPQPPPEQQLSPASCPNAPSRFAICTRHCDGPASR
ncbi:hypothetical protein WS70_05845 [Burkholderia mayonis]|uniref:Uncharacterized protein n=1 Tax=Burkholderia mayonis TaxID=1385591 RepID=A0A1B4FCL2_9BURK|nr:hypothetical protein WS70_05845 [Burkholderia mayonis]KVE49103.1 hypothetical protein WS70_20980 [Burkholderia mayonis]